MKKLTVVLAVLISGCAAQQFKEASMVCDAGPIPQIGACLESELDTRVTNWRQIHDAPAAMGYIAWLKAAGKEVETGKMSEAEFWEKKQAYLAGITTRGGGNGAALTAAGLAILNANNRPVPVYTPTINPPIRCHSYSYGNTTNTNCY